LRAGREALAASLANEIGDSYDFFITRMIFGDSGVTGGVPKHVSSDRNGLFGITRINKPVIATIEPTIRSQVLFTAIIDKTEGNGLYLSEMALVMNNDDLYSMATFPELGKTSQMAINWSWRLSVV
jgi:hypothetical protein